MTKEEAITNLNMINVAFIENVTTEQRKLINDTFEMAIKALKQESSTDAVSRQDAIMHINFALDAEDAVKRVEELPPVTPTRPKGKWIEHHNPEAEICMQHMSECSVCGKMICGRYNIYKNFCPNCGEKMEEQKTT